MNALQSAVTAAPEAVRIASSDRAPRVPLLFTLGAGIALFLIVGLFHIWSRVAILDQGYAIGKQRAVREELLQDQKSLQLELARLRDPARLEHSATAYGLGPAKPGQFVIMGAGE